MKTLLSILIIVCFLGLVKSQNHKTDYKISSNEKNIKIDFKKEKEYKQNNKIHDFNKENIESTKSKNNIINYSKQNKRTGHFDYTFKFPETFYNSTCNRNINTKNFSKLSPRFIELFACSHHFWGLNFNLMIERWFLLAALLNSFEITATLKDWEIAPNQKSGIFLFDITNSPEQEKLSKQILVTIQKPTLYKDDFFEQNKTYTFFITKYKSLAWQSLISSKFDNKKLTSFFGLIIENKI